MAVSRHTKRRRSVVPRSCLACVGGHDGVIFLLVFVCRLCFFSLRNSLLFVKTFLASSLPAGTREGGGGVVGSFVGL